ncbi:hypothetical protein BASA81_010298 [Batrachochytrium salamandrivorans]|nr:hypothetical protein BASA81_010298 [Batrachochytrium salamandrivorans]
MGGFLDKPIVEKDTAVGQGKVGEHMLRYGVSSMQGWRVEMEDSHVTEFNVGPTPEQLALFCVFDGHAGEFPRPPLVSPL